MKHKNQTNARAYYARATKTNADELEKKVTMPEIKQSNSKE